MNILGISDVTGNHSHSCVALLQDGKLTFALSQERPSRIKNDPQFPTDALQLALDYTGLRLQDINCFVCSYPPARYYSSLMQYGIMDLSRAFGGVLVRKPITLARYLFPNIRKGLFDPKGTNGLYELGVKKEDFWFVDHHLAHVSAGYFSSGFDKALAFSYGGFAPHTSGRNVAGAVYFCEGDRIQFIEDIPMFAAGCYYSAISVALGFKYMQQEGKTMALAKTADYHDCYDHLRKITSRFRHGKWKKYKHWVDYIMSPRADAFLGTKSGRRLSKLIKRYGSECVAAAAQRLWEKNIYRLIRHYRHMYDTGNIVLTGGTFLNVQINRTIAELEGVDKIFVHPHTGDGSTTIGAVIEAHRDLTGSPVRLDLSDTGLGVDYTDEAIENAIRRQLRKLMFTKLDNIIDYTAERLAEGKIIGWFQGREEYGQRALGHRCILADPRDMELKHRITRHVKGRENFIPMSPSILVEHGSTYFENFDPTPFMTRVYDIKGDKLEEIKPVSHKDCSARVQAVDAACYPLFRHLLESFHKLTGMPMLMNTSLNRHGEVIVHRPEEAISLLLNTAMDELIIGSFAVKKLQGDDTI